jgi:dihydrofolate reductase
MITIIAACNANRVIGNDNKLIYRIPDDMKRFKELTLNRTVLMGRKTYDSIGKPLPNRVNIIISRNKELVINNCLIYFNLNETINMFKNDLVIIGGEEIYKQSIHLADTIELTMIEDVATGDAYFPVIPNYFKLINQIDKEYSNLKYSFQTFVKI